MLQFWKKSGSNGSYAKNTNFTNDNSDNRQQTTKTVVATVDHPPTLPPIHEGDLYNIDEFESIKERSRLAKSLEEVLLGGNGDGIGGALSYFLEFMEAHNAAAYPLCWLEIESFKSEVRAEQQNMNKNPFPVPVPKTQRMDHDDSLSFASTDCDDYSLTADSNSLDYSDRVTVTPPQWATVTVKATETTTTTKFCDKSANSGHTSPSSSSALSCKNDLTESALSVFKKYIAQEANYDMKIDENIRKETIENICDTNKVLKGNCFDVLQDYLYNLMEKEYFYTFLTSDYYAKHQIDILTSGHVALGDILYNETALFYFMEFLEQENSRNLDLLEFWIAATNFQQQFKNSAADLFDPIEIQNDAVLLYDKYFSLQAHSPLGFSDNIRFQLEQEICAENGLANHDCFHLPIKLVEQILERNYLKLFLDSQLFYKYLSELINTVQANGYSMNLLKKNNSKSLSDCSNSSSTNSTFLALEFSPNLGKKNKPVMSIDSRELSDPDSLWKRKKTFRGLSCGRVTELGKFETSLEPEPGSDRKQSRLKNVVKKFVNLEEEDRKKEEMAWQVAEMIVKDVTSVTLNHQQAHKS